MASSLFDLTGQVAVVTGSTKGIGKSIAEELGRAGAKVMISSRKADACEATRAELAGSVGPQWLVIVYVLHTIGELMLSPVGLAMVSRMAPASLAGLLMGVWLFSSAVANYLAGVLEGLLAGSGMPLFGFLIASSIGAGLVLLLLTPRLERLMSRSS